MLHMIVFVLSWVFMERAHIRCIRMLVTEILRKISVASSEDSVVVRNRC